MKYVNAKILLPDILVEELQGYIQGVYKYMPPVYTPVILQPGYREEVFLHLHISYRLPP